MARKNSKHWMAKGEYLRRLSRAIRRVPTGEAMNRPVAEGRRWDPHTGLFLRPRTES